jgi:ABC-type transport system substrate-binding protein
VGIPKGSRIEFLERSGLISDVEGCQVAIGQLKKIGVEASMRVVDTAAWMKGLRDGDYSISLRGDSERLDPDDAITCVCIPARC